MGSRISVLTPDPPTLMQFRTAKDMEEARVQFGEVMARKDGGG